MKRRGFVYQGLFFSVGIIVLVVCVSCKPQPGGPVASTDGFEKCKIRINDLSADQTCDVSKAHNDRVVWVNDSRSDLFVCADDPSRTVFDAYAWLVRAGQKGKSGKIRDDFSAPSGAADSVLYHVSGSPCSQNASGLANTQTNPKIIIKASN
jgi:hypothetical protein